MKDKQISVIPDKVSEKALIRNMERYCLKVIEMGAVEAKIIPSKIVVVDERVRLKCMIGRCFNYGKCANCPPHTPEPDYMRKALSRFHWAVVFRSEVIPTSDYITSDKLTIGKHNRHTLELSAAIESWAFHDGYYLAMGFSSGDCREALCGGLYCQVLDSKQCRFPLKSRPSMEAVGIDVLGLAAKIGWKMYPIHRNVDPATVPCASSIGITFIY